jgi:hypothetical protein
MKIPSYTYVLSFLGEHMEILRPKNKPNKERVAAARANATSVNSYLGAAKLTMEIDKSNGRIPNLAYLGIPEGKKIKQIAPPLEEAK